jgi:uncharacterized membrane protein
MARSSSPLHVAFLAAIAIKGLDGLIEAVAGLIFAIAGSERVYDFALWATAPELERHPASHAVHAIRHGAYGLTHASHRFVITYLLIHGLIKLALVINLMIEKMWVFPVSVALLLGFIAVMGVKLTHQWSAWLFAFAMFDVITVALVAHEWRVRRQT